MPVTVYSLADPVTGAVHLVAEAEGTVDAAVLARTAPAALQRPSRLARWLARLARAGLAPVPATLAGDLATEIAAAEGGGAILYPDDAGAWVAPAIADPSAPAVQAVVQAFLRSDRVGSSAIPPDLADSRVLTEARSVTVAGEIDRAALLAAARREAAERARLAGRG